MEFFIPYYKTTDNVNICKPRAYYVPFGEKQKYSSERTDSQRFVSLNGEWSIEEYKSILDVEDFWNATPSDKINVPSCVQYYGYDYFQYTNIWYPFPYNPPIVPNENPAYHYMRTFEYEKTKEEKVYFITEGVDSCYYLYVNNTFVGFTQITHKLTEFDITPYLVDGENKIDMLVLKWCAGTYLEDQDKWRFTGIFRDVYLLKRPENHITDYKITTEVDGENAKVKFAYNGKQIVNVTFNGISKQTCGEEVIFEVENAKLWSAETPYLYDMTISCNGENIFEKVGIRTTEVKNGLFLVNGKAIKLYGVNRHDFHPEKGYAVSEQDIENDLILMKKLNVNAVRTSHYPSSPYFYNACDRLGLYVMSESDLEAHGCSCLWKYDPEPWTKAMCTAAEDEQFRQTFVERQIFNVENNKNRACVIIWSLGNEAGWGQNHLAALKQIKSMDTRPVHYESMVNYDRERYTEDEFYAWELDMHSRMYTHPKWIEDEYLKDEKEKRPLVYCEYQHAMGNGPGGFKEYWDIFENNDRCFGGFVWEWADHGVTYCGKKERYGGDFGEHQHDGNFCIDGIVSAYRNLKSGSKQMKYYYQPLRFERVDNTITVFNKNFFAPETGELIITQNGEENRVTICVPARQSISLEVKDGTVNLEYIRDGQDWVCSTEQFYVNAYQKREVICANVDISEKGRYIFVSAGKNAYKLSKISGEIESFKVDGNKFKNLKLNFWRGTTDNDKPIEYRWLDKFVHVAYPNVLDYKIDNNKVSFDIGVGYTRMSYILTATLCYEFNANGVEISIDYKTMQCDGYNFYEHLPRLGLRIRLPKTFDKLKYLAYGNDETYSDLYEFAFKGEYESDVKSQYYPYAKPQESGSHYLPEYMCLSDGNITFYAEGMQSFSAIPYSAKTLTNTKHNSELPESEHTYLCLDYCMSGVGTGSCGPRIHKQYQVPDSGFGKIRLFFDVKE